MDTRRAAPVTPPRILLRGVAVAGTSLAATAVVTGVLLIPVLTGAWRPGGLDSLGSRILLSFGLIGAGVVTLVVTGVFAARWWRLPRPVFVAVGGPVAAVALAPVLGVLVRLVAPDVEWEGLALREFDGPWFITVAVTLVVGDAVVAWAASGRDARMTGTMLTVVALVVGASLVDGPLAGRGLVHDYATLGVPLLVPADRPVTGATPEVRNWEDSPLSVEKPAGPVGVLALRTDAVAIRIEPLPVTDLSCADLFSRSVRPGLDYSFGTDTCEQLSPDRWLVVYSDTGRPNGLVALRPDALVDVRLRDPWARTPADGVALMQEAVGSLVPATAERLAALPQE